MFGLKCIDSGNTSAARQVVQRRVAFAQCDRVLFRNVRQKFAKTPHAALIKGFEDCLAIGPDGLQGLWIVTSARKHELEEIATVRAAEILRGGRGSRVTSDATKD